jgi:hypothetical protein
MMIQGRADHECSSGKDRGECKKIGDGGSEETLYENEDSIYTQSSPETIGISWLGSGLRLSAIEHSNLQN